MGSTMLFRGVRWRMASPYVLLILVVMGAYTLYIPYVVRTACVGELQAHLKAKAQIAARDLETIFAFGGSDRSLDSLVRGWSEGFVGEAVAVAADGRVWGAPSAVLLGTDDVTNSSEVQQALATGWGHDVRFHEQTGQMAMYGAVSFTLSDDTRGVVWVADSLARVESRVTQVRWIMIVMTGISVILAFLMALMVGERTARPIRQLTRAAERMGRGDFNARVFPTQLDEVGVLAQTFNWMAEQLSERMAALAQERGRLAAVLEYMADGVLITDGQGIVRLINRAAAHLLGTTQAAALDRSYVQVVRDHQLVEVWQHCSTRDEGQVATVELDRQSLFLRIIVTPIREAGAQACLVMLQDLTQIRRLETVRRDFISNISHELRTPLASLKALVDTLRDGALDDPPAAERFLDRIETEVDDLTQIVQELLELARIESGQVPLRLTSTAVEQLVRPVVERLQTQAERAELDLQLIIPFALPSVLADAERAQQVVTNLVHNAIKFTPPGGRIVVEVKELGGEVLISVQDTGVGISRDDLPRIFERFYKADRARSGGGTGLGLAIARHIVQAHGGRIWAESVEGQGSTFYLSLPVVN